MERARNLGGERGKIGWLVHGLHAAGFDTRKIQQRVDQLQQPHTVAVHELQFLAVCRRPGVRVEHGFERAEHQRKRRPKLVTDIAEEDGFCAVDFGQRLRLFALFFVCPRVRDGVGDVASDQLEERAKTLVKRFRGLTPAITKPIDEVWPGMRIGRTTPEDEGTIHGARLAVVPSSDREILDHRDL